MRRISSAAERARWLAEVAQALNQAQALVERMTDDQGHGRKRAELIHRIAAAQQLTRTLRLGSDRRMGREVRPQ